MEVALFIPCYINQFYPSVAKATLRLLENLDIRVVFPVDQTCCGQPMANAGFGHLSRTCHHHFLTTFGAFDYIVSPSGSCVLHLREQLCKGGGDARRVSNRTFELTEFLADVVQTDSLGASFPHRVGLHQSCHGQRGLGLSQMSELVAPPFSKPEKLLRMVEGLELIPLSRPDECCGFGGTFCVSEEAVSVKMGKDRIADHLHHGAEYITGNDMSCLMHLEGILRRQRSAVKVIHIAEILLGHGA